MELHELEKTFNAVVDDVISVALPESLLQDTNKSNKTPLSDSIYEGWRDCIGQAYRINDPQPISAAPFNLIGIVLPYLRENSHDLQLMESHLQRMHSLRMKATGDDLVLYLYHMDTLARLIANNKSLIQYEYDIKSRSFRFEYLVTHWRLVAYYFRIYANKSNTLKERLAAVEFCISVISHLLGHINKKRGSPFLDSSRLFHIDSPNAISNTMSREDVLRPMLKTASEEDNYALRVFFGGPNGAEARLSLFMAFRYEVYYEIALVQFGLRGDTTNNNNADPFVALFNDMGRLVKLAEFEDLIGVTYAISCAYTNAVKALTNNKHNADKETDCYLVLKAYLWRWLTAYLKASLDFDAFNVTGDIKIGKQALKRIEEARESEKEFRKEFIDVKASDASTTQQPPYTEGWLVAQYDPVVKQIRNLYAAIYDVVTGLHYETTDNVQLVPLVAFEADLPETDTLSEALFAIHEKCEQTEPGLISLMTRLNDAIHEQPISTGGGGDENTTLPSMAFSTNNVDSEAAYIDGYEQGVEEERKRWLSYLMPHTTKDGKMIIIPADRIREDYAELCL